MEISTNLILAWFWLTLLAWIATAIWAFLAFFVKRENHHFLSFWLGISAWVMIYISFVEVIPKSLEFFSLAGYQIHAELFMILSLALWIGISLIIDMFLPPEINPDEPKNPSEMQQLQAQASLWKNKKLYRAWLLTAFVITLHNIPEWLITFLSTLVSLEIGITVAIALALHKIPEWFAVSLPIYYATGNKLKAFFYTSISGMANVVGALIWFVFLQYFVSNLVLWILFAMIAGIMIFVSFHQLLPTASQYNRLHIEVYGVLVWMIITGWIMAFLSYL